VPLASIAAPAVPLAVVGFGVAVMSGACLLTTNASEYAGNPFLLIKFSAIALGLVNVAVLHVLPAWKERAERAPTEAERFKLALTGGASLASWVTALAAGRLIGYW
jgi:hypothetical protein